MELKRTWANIYLDNLKKNFDVVRNTVGNDVDIMSVVKANAYGHGAAEIATCLEQHGSNWFAVSNIVEGIELRRAGVTKPILIMGFTPPEYAGELSDNRLTATLINHEYALALSNAAVSAGVTIDCHIKLDTGMSRIGFECRDIAETADVIRDVAGLAGLALTGAYSHFTSADMFDEASIAFTKKQGELFEKVTLAAQQRGVNFKHRHCCNSAGLLFYKQFHFNMVRPGIILCGISPTGEPIDGVPLYPVMEEKSHIIQIKHLHTGDAVGYCREFIATSDMTVATIPVGYADGYFRALKGIGMMYVHGELAPILGRINMDQLVVDITNIPAVCGEEITVFGGETPLSADNVAGLCGTNSYELVSAVSRRVPRVFFENGTQSAFVDYLL